MADKITIKRIIIILTTNKLFEILYFLVPSTFYTLPFNLFLTPLNLKLFHLKIFLLFFYLKVFKIFLLQIVESFVVV